jgi:hypothetical protein
MQRIQKGKDIRKKKHLASFVFVPSVLGEKFPTAEFRMISAETFWWEVLKIAKCLMRTFTCPSSFLSGRMSTFLTSKDVTLAFLFDRYKLTYTADRTILLLMPTWTPVWLSACMSFRALLVQLLYVSLSLCLSVCLGASLSVNMSVSLFQFRLFFPFHLSVNPTRLLYFLPPIC